jgi:hypothetical protein
MLQTRIVEILWVSFVTFGDYELSGKIPDCATPRWKTGDEIPAMIERVEEASENDFATAHSIDGFHSRIASR